jgi:hypothetical protein
VFEAAGFRESDASDCLTEPSAIGISEALIDQGFFLTVLYDAPAVLFHPLAPAGRREISMISTTWLLAHYLLL